MYNNTANAFAAYQENSVLTASKGKLLLMLYDGAIKFLKFSKVAIDENNLGNSNKYLLKSQDIISELRITLDMNYEVSRSLDALYEYMNYKLIEANLKKNRDIIDEVLNMLIELRDTWEKALKDGI